MTKIYEALQRSKKQDRVLDTASENRDHPAEEQSHSVPAKVVRTNENGSGSLPEEYKSLQHELLALLPDIHPLPEEYKRLRQSIVTLLPDTGPKVLLFTSPTEGEGSAILAAKFSFVLAALDERVVLVDAHLREPVLHHIFNIEQTPGLSELLSCRSSLAEASHRVALEKIHIIPGGSPMANPFSSRQLQMLDSTLGTMKSAADWIILSCPPVNVYNDAAALARMVQGVVLVIKAEATRWEVAQSAKATLEKAGANILGVVLNDRKYHIPDWIYRRL